MSSKNAELLLILVTIIAAAGWVFSKSALAGLPPFAFVSLRFSIAALVLGSLCMPQILGLARQELIRCILTGGVLGLSILFWVLGLQNTASIGEGAFVISLAVLFVPVIGRMVFSETIPSSLVIALLPALAGLALLTLENGFKLELGQFNYLIATLGFALHLNLSSHFSHKILNLPNSAVQLCMVGLIGLLSTLMFEEWPSVVSHTTWSWVLASAVVATSLRFSLQLRALSAMNASHASMIFLLEPVWTAFLGYLLLSEQLSPSKQMGCLLILASLLVFRWPALNAWLKERR